MRLCYDSVCSLDYISSETCPLNWCRIHWHRFQETLCIHQYLQQMCINRIFSDHLTTTHSNKSWANKAAGWWPSITLTVMSVLMQPVACWALTPVASWGVHTLRYGDTGGQASSTLIFILTMKSTNATIQCALQADSKIILVKWQVLT